MNEKGYPQAPPAYGETQGYSNYQQYPNQNFYQPPNTYSTQPHVIVQPQPTVVVVGGGCPNCRVGVLTEEYGCCAILLAICFFPLGVLCCLAMKERVCTNCRARF